MFLRKVQYVFDFHILEMQIFLATVPTNYYGLVCAWQQQNSNKHDLSNTFNTWVNNWYVDQLLETYYELVFYTLDRMM